MDDEPSVQRWLNGVAAGDPAATEELWNYCFPQLVRFARRKLRGTPRRAADEEDVALDAMDSFCRAVREGRFPELAGQSELLRLLLQMTARKAAHLVRREMSAGRGKAGVRGTPPSGTEAPRGRLIPAGQAIACPSSPPRRWRRSSGCSPCWRNLSCSPWHWPERRVATTGDRRASSVLAAHGGAPSAPDPHDSEAGISPDGLHLRGTASVFYADLHSARIQKAARAAS